MPQNNVLPCPLCGMLRDKEFSFSKYGSDYPDQPLPPAAAKLLILNTPTMRDIEKQHVRRCPQCGALFSYLASHEYFINGTEEEEELVRMTPAQVNEFLLAEARALEALRRDIALYRDQAGRLGDYLDRAHPSDAEAREAMNDMQESCQKADELDKSLTSLVAYLRASCPEILSFWAQNRPPDSELARIENPAP